MHTAELHRSHFTGPHGITHLTRRVSGTPRNYIALCGRYTRGMRKMGWFDGWANTLCAECGAAADALDTA